MVFKTDRLLLREFESTDAQALFDLNNDPLVIQYTGDPPFSSVEAASQFIGNYTGSRPNGSRPSHYKEFGYGRWAVLNKETKEYLGWCGLKYTPDLKETDLGFRFFRKFWNQGFATEAASGCLTFGFEELGLNVIVGRAMRDNKASIKVLTKIGMKFQKTILMDGNKGVQYSIMAPR